MRKVAVLCIMTSCIFGSYLLMKIVEGSRFTATAAVKAQSTVGKDATVFNELDLPWGKVILLHTSHGDRTAVVRKAGLFWFCNAVTTFDKQNDSDHVRTIGWLNAQFTDVNPPQQIALIAVVTHDPKVKTIEVGVGKDRVKKPIEQNKALLIWWPKAFIGSSLTPLALSSEGKQLYEYRFAKANVTDSRTLKWYPINS
jgi:hypothetical protein